MISPVVRFTTERGSEYTVVDLTRTSRKKKARAEHGTDAGMKTTSELTVYIDPKAAKEFGMAQGLSPVDAFTVLLGGDTVQLAAHTYGRWRRVVAPTSFYVTPRVGLCPLELWGFQRLEETPEFGVYHFDNWHPGNAIVQMTASPSRATSSRG